MKIFKFLKIDMIEKGHFKKYALYAFGEIFLIFLGINLAIWFNNWNESSKLKLEELKVLKELKSGLTDDLDELVYYIGLHEKAEISGKIILNHLDKNIQYHDSLDLHFGKASLFSGSFPKIGAYESLKSKGLGLISNDSLRLKITNLYEAQFPYLLYIQKFDESNFQIFSDQYKTKFANWTLFESATPVDYNSLIDDNYFKEHLRYTLNHKRTTLGIMEIAREKISSTIDAIDKELK